MGTCEVRDVATKPARLAKLAPPRLRQVVARERLYRLLDEKRAHPVVWVSGPPGSGKTTLVASYLRAVAAPALWYHLDRGDSDPATLFYFLSEAVACLSPPRTRRLPLLTPEYLPDLEGFARRFLRNAFARLPAGACVVFDNYHEVAEHSLVHRTLNAACSEIPQTANLIVISRAPAPAAFARLGVADALATVGWDDLRLTAAETAAIAAARGHATAGGLVETIHVQSDGWVAAVRLLLDRMESIDAAAQLSLPESLDGVFDYIASEIFDAASQEVQQVLLRTAFLPRFTVPIATAVSATERAGRVLQDLHRRRLFVERRLGREPTFEYHDLFRAFLQVRATRAFTAAQLASLARESAQQLLAGGLVEEAFALFAQAQDWEAAEQLLVDRAQMLIAQGRWRTLDEWGRALPVERAHHNPWLGYWLGRSKTLVDPAAARLMLEEAHAAFVARDDDLGALLSATAVLDALHFEVRAFQLLEPWLDRLGQLVDACRVQLAVEDELRLHAALLMASHLAVATPMLTRAVEKVKQLLPRCTDANLTLSVANMVHYHSAHTLDFEAHRVAASAARAMLDRSEISSDRLALYWLAEGHAHYSFTRYAQGLNCFGRADAIIDEHGLAQRAVVAAAWRCQCEAAIGDVHAAQATVAAFEARSDAGQGYSSVLFEFAKGTVAFAAGDRARSIELTTRAVERNRASGSPVSHVLFLPRLAYRLVATGRLDEADAVLAEQQPATASVSYCRVGATLAALQAWVALARQDFAGCERSVRQAMILARDERECLRLRWIPLALAALLPFALQRGIEVESARKLIASNGLRPSDPSLEDWPWPVRIHTLGDFEVLVGDQPIPFGRKTPKRTLALLKAIVAFGGREVPEQHLADALWPDQDGDLAHESLAAALHRMRRLLGAGPVILQSGAKLSLNAEVCFVDVWAFEAGLRHAGQEHAALRLYRGAFLQGETDAPWSVSLRERLRTKFVAAVRAAAQRLEDQARYEEAAALYARGIDVDELVEPFYQGLMRSYRSLGRVAEAAAAYRRLSRTLAATLGLQPSPDSRRLFEALCQTQAGA
jgi:ATP/maltotriose-dependent transcriptional regulator MalT/DNA-binding SARP family transcriptional activator